MYIFVWECARLLHTDTQTHTHAICTHNEAQRENTCIYRAHVTNTHTHTHTHTHTLFAHNENTPASIAKPFTPVQYMHV